ncbi:MAG: hypothetical protein ACM3X7_00465 [Solirubrobacterales bacterium]
MDNKAVISTLTLSGTSLKKLEKFLPENSVKKTPNSTSDPSKYDLEADISGILFTGKGEVEDIKITSFNRNYSNEELLALQKLAKEIYTYPFGGMGFIFGLNIISSEETENIIKNLLIKYNIAHSTESLDSEGHIELNISDIKDFSTTFFIDFLLELQTLTNL